MRYLIAFLVIAMASPAWATWTTAPGGANTKTEVGQRTGGRTGDAAFYDFSDVLQSLNLGTGACGSIDVQFNPDTTGVATGAEVQVYRCSRGGASTTDCVKVCALRGGATTCDTLNGDETSQRAGFQNLQAQSIWVDVTVNGGSAAGRVSVTCH